MKKFVENDIQDKGTSSIFTSRKPLKICLLGYRSKPHCGGQGIYIKYLSAALSELGHAVDVISGEPYPELEQPVRLIKLPGKNLFEKTERFSALELKDLKSYTNFFEWFSVLSGGFPEPYTFGRRVVKYIKTQRPAYDLIHDNQSLGYGLLTLQKMGLPVIATIHHPITIDKQIALVSANGYKHRLLIKRWYSFLSMQKRVARELNHLLTVSNRSKKDIVTAFDLDAAKISVVYNGIDTAVFAPRPEIQRIPGRIMATASADMPLKGLDYLLRAISGLKGDFPELDLLVVGSPKSGGHTEKLIHQLGIQAHVRFRNNLTTEEIVRYYAEASLAVIPSLYEGFGLPAGEAMACGTPVISSDGGALPEIVGDAGILVPAGNSTALADAIREMLVNLEKRHKLGAQGRQRIQEKFSWQAAAKQMTRYYRDVLNHADRRF